MDKSESESDSLESELESLPLSLELSDRTPTAVATYAHKVYKLKPNSINLRALKVTSWRPDKFSMSSNKGMLPAAGSPLELARSWCGDELFFFMASPELCLGEILRDGLENKTKNLNAM